MNEYELLYIVPSQFTDEEVGGVQKNVNALVEKVGGKVIAEHNLGKIRLAYTINKVRHGTYILAYIDVAPEKANALDRELRLHDEVLRHTILTRPPGAMEKTFELSSYVAPLSEEAREQKRESAPRKVPTAPTPMPTPVTIAPPVPSATTAGESKMSMEELDKKLDKILEADVTENL